MLGVHVEQDIRGMSAVWRDDRYQNRIHITAGERPTVGERTSPRLDRCAYMVVTAVSWYGVVVVEQGRYADRLLAAEGR